MELRREEFISQFAIPFHVHCLRLWSRRAPAPPYSVARCCVEWITTGNGSVSLRLHDFRNVAWPVIDELYRVTPRGRRPDANDLAGRLYDALDAAGAEVVIGAGPTSS